MSHKALAYKNLVQLNKDSQIPRAGFLGSQILYPLEKSNFLFLFLFQGVAVKAKSHCGFTTEPMFQFELMRFVGSILSFTDSKET